MLELSASGHQQSRSNKDHSHASLRLALPLPLAPTTPKYTYLRDDKNVDQSNWSPPLPPEQARPIAVNTNANMPPKRPSDVAESPTDSAGNPKFKLPRLDRGPEDFSNAVKNKLQTYTRTGQACDRCKVRSNWLIVAWLVPVAVLACRCLLCLEL